MEVTRLKTEYKINPLGIDSSNPRLSWEILSDLPNTVQSAYQIRAASNSEDLLNGNKLLWDSGKIESNQSIHVNYTGSKLKSTQRIYWQVTVWDNNGNQSTSGGSAFFEMGLLQTDDWPASWITSCIQEDNSKSTPSSYFRKQFNIQKTVSEARIYASALGLYELSLNGKKVGNELFTPGWTSYQERIQYQTYDVTSELHSGVNTLGSVLGDGWYRGFLVWQGNKNTYGDKSALILQLKITYTDGSVDWIVTDKNWKASSGPIIQSDIYNGEIYDSRRELTGWNEANFDDSNWNDVVFHPQSKEVLVTSVGSPVRITKTIHPVKKWLTPKEELVFDLGQNMVGWVRFRLKGKRGSKITLNHAEVLDQDGNFHTDNLRGILCEEQYIFKGDSIETYEPHFTFHGFRYIKVSDYEGEITLDDIEGRVIHSDMEHTGNFECSNEMVNQLQSNIEWGLRGNFLDVPTDCPQRDERLGWTGDAQVFASTACFNMNVAPFFTKWLKDFPVEQKADGSIPWVVPNVVPDGGGTGWSDGFGATGWADAAVIIPWEIYQKYGDENILEAQYASMRGWVSYMMKEAGDSYLFNSGFHFGDWLSFAEYTSQVYNAPDYGFAGAHTEKDLIATAYFYHSTSILQKTASLLGKHADEKIYAWLLPKIKDAFRNEFITPNGRLLSNTQTAYAIALSFGLIPEEFIETATKRLADNVEHFQHLTTGFLGTPILCDALSDFGHPELAYKLLFNTEYPSWLYAISKGATTIWERWDGIKPDDSFQDTGMNSFNHYAYGAIGNWLYTRVAGISSDPEHPGYKHIIIKPVLTENLNFAGASYQSMHGEIKSRWEREGSKVKLSVTIPPNTQAKIHIPASENASITLNGKSIASAKDITLVGFQNGYYKVETGSGTFVFESTQI